MSFFSNWNKLFLLLCLLPFSLRAQTEKAGDVEATDSRIEQIAALARTKPDSSLQLAQALYEQVRTSESPLLRVKACKLLGDVQASTGRLREAEAMLRLALQQARSLGDSSLLVRLYNNLGGVYLRMNRDERSIAYFDSTILYGEKYLNKLQQAVVLSNIGLAQRHVGRYTQAEFYHLRALNVYMEEKAVPRIAREYNNLGILKKEEGKLQEAMNYLQEAHRMYVQQNDALGQAKALNNQADVLLLQGEARGALEKLQEALRIKNELHNAVGLMNSNKLAGDAYLDLSDYERSIEHYTLSLAYADSIQNQKQKSEIYEKLARLYEEKGELALANSFLKKRMQLADSLHARELIEQLAQSASRLDLDTKEEALEDMAEKAKSTTAMLEQRDRILFLVLPLVSIIFGLAAVYIRRYRRERQANQVLAVQKAEISRQKHALEENRLLISQKNAELETAREIIERANHQLRQTNEELEAKVRERSKAAEQAYRKLALHLNNAAFVVLEWDGAYRLTDWPAQAQQLFGWQDVEVLGMHMNEVPFALRTEAQPITELIDQLAATKQIAGHELVSFTNKVGENLFVEWTHSVLLDEQGKVESVLSFGLNVTQREQAFAELESAYKELDTFLYKSSHDLRGPLARLQGIINLACMESKDEVALQYFAMQKQVTYELNQLLLRLHQVHTIFEHEPELEPIVLHDFLATQLEKSLQQGRLAKKVKVINSIPESFIMQADANLLALILGNIIENSTSFTDNTDPFLSFQLESAPAGRLKLRICDNGMTIPKQYHERMFDLFFQGSTRSAGAGLGLYMARKAAKRLQGDIRLFSEDRLTVFEIELPMVQQAVEA